MYNYEDLPNLHQLLVLLYRLNTLDTLDLKPKLIYHLAKNFSQFQSLFPPTTGSYRDAGHFLINQEGKSFVDELWAVYQGKPDTFPLPTDHKVRPDQVRFLMDLPYHIVQPMPDELIQYYLEKHRETLTNLFPTLLTAGGIKSEEDAAFVRFANDQFYFLRQGEVLTDLTSPQIALLKKLHSRLPRLFYLNNIPDQLAAHRAKLKESMLIPLFETFFMAVRGHCIKLESRLECDKVSCTDGAYLRLLQGIQETVSFKLKDETFVNQSAFLQLVQCA